MNSELAEQLLAKVMEWNEETVAKERPLIQALASYKFDEYQQFFPGMRFIESFAQWLNQFDKKEKEFMYNFIKARLIYISNAEMNHFVSMAYPDIIRKILVRKIASKPDISIMDVKTIEKSDEFKIALRKSLFLGLSDGARMDFFRRYNQVSISNEQVWLTYEISKGKAISLLDDLGKSLKKILHRDPSDAEKKFETIFLLDDFSASGTSYFRLENEKFTGKIAKTIKKFFPDFQSSEDKMESDNLSNLIISHNLEIHVILYVMTEEAKERIESEINNWKSERNVRMSITIHPIQLILNTSKIDIEKEIELRGILSKYFDDTIIDEHWKKGKHATPFLGYNECALPVILSHNAPNNSLPILWFEHGRRVDGLFPRISRHKSE